MDDRHSHHSNQGWPSLQRHDEQDLGRSRAHYDPSAQKVRNIESQISKMQAELEQKRARNMELKSELQHIEHNQKSGDGGSLLLEKDRLKQEVSGLIKELVKKNDNLRRLTVSYKLLVDENEQLIRDVAELEKNEQSYDKTIEEYSKAIEECEVLRNALEESEFMKHEQLFLTQMKLEENSRKQMEMQVRDIADKMSKNKDLAKQYLLKYIDYLEAQVGAKSR